MAWYLLIELLYDVPIILFNLLLYWHIMNYIISYYLSYSCYIFIGLLFIYSSYRLFKVDWPSFIYYFYLFLFIGQSI